MALLIIDKSFLRAASAQDLQALGRVHIPVLPPALFYEIMTEPSLSVEDQRKHYLDKIQNVPFSVCRGIRDLEEKEKRFRRPATDCLDADVTQECRNRIARREILGDPEGEVRAHEAENVQYMRSRLCAVCTDRRFDRLASVLQNLARELNCSQLRALVLRSESVARETWGETYPNLSALACPRSVAFTNVWLRNYLVLRRRKDSGLDWSHVSDKALANDYWDNHYIVMLSLADGLVSEDRILLETARAFFPRKIFMSLEDITRDS